MNNKYFNIYNNLVKLTRNKKIFQNLAKDETFSDRLIILLFHFSFFLKVYKSDTTKAELQKIHDFFFKQIEISIREIGYGDMSINNIMKDYANLFYFIIDRIHFWNELAITDKKDFISNLLNIENNTDFFVDYFEKYILYLKNNTFNCFTKDVIKHNF